MNERASYETSSAAATEVDPWSNTAAPWSVMPRVPMVETVVARLRERPDAAVLIFEDGATLSRGELLSRAEKFAAYLIEHVPERSPVALALENRAEFFIAWLAMLGTGHPMISMNPAVRETDATHMLRDSGAVLAVAGPAAANVLNAVKDRCAQLRQILVVGNEEPDGLSAFQAQSTQFDLLSAPPQLDAISYISYTSGTTGTPKGCVHLHGEVVRYADIAGRLYRLEQTDRILNPLQFYYGDSIWLFCLALKLDLPYVSMRRFSVSRFWPVVRQFGITVFLGIGAIPNLLLKGSAPDEERSSVRMAIQIGVPAAQHSELIERFGFPWYDLYGLSETGLNIAMPPALAHKYVGTGAIGYPVPEVTVELIADDTSRVIGPGTGEIIVRGPFMMDGYLGQPAATAEITYSDFIRTGDEAYRDDDGVYYFRGRKKEIIRRGGENIAPYEIESVLREYPNIADAAVVPVVDDVRGEEVMAYVYVPDGDIDFHDVVDFCKRQLAPHKVPRYLAIRREPFPRTPSQRIKKSELMIDGAHSTHAAWDQTKDNQQ